jgi:hypothetical protein
MNKKSKVMSYIFLSIFALLACEVAYMQGSKTTNAVELDKKRVFVKLSGLPDLAISNEAYYTRHRTLATLSSIYGDDGSLREYMPSTYAISYSHIINPHIKVDNEK